MERLIKRILTYATLIKRNSPFKILLDIFNLHISCVHILAVGQKVQFHHHHDEDVVFDFNGAGGFGGGGPPMHAEAEKSHKCKVFGCEAFGKRKREKLIKEEPEEEEDHIKFKIIDSVLATKTRMPLLTKPPFS